MENYNKYDLIVATGIRNMIVSSGEEHEVFFNDFDLTDKTTLFLLKCAELAHNINHITIYLKVNPIKFWYMKKKKMINTQMTVRLSHKIIIFKFIKKDEILNTMCKGLDTSYNEIAHVYDIYYGKESKHGRTMD